MITALSKYPETIEHAALNRAPHALVHYLRDLANTLHTYYNAEKFIVEDAALRNARITLVLAVQQVIRNGLGILGVSAPERCRERHPWPPKSPAAISSAARAGGMRFDFGRWREFGVGLALGLSLSLFVLIWQNYREKEATGAVAADMPRPEPRPDKTAAAGDAGGRREELRLLRHAAELRSGGAGEGSRGRQSSAATRRRTIERPGVYVLQAGSYRQQEVADRMRAQLKLQGIDANVQRVAVDEDVWYRVRIGPHHRPGRGQSPARAPARGRSRSAGHPRRRMSMRGAPLRSVCAAGVLWLLAGCATPPPAAPAPPPTPTPEPAPAAPPLPAPAHPGLTLAAVGDIMMGTDFPENILPDDDGVGFLEAVTPLLSRARRDLRQSRGRAAGRR